MAIEQKLHEKYASHGIVSSDYLYLPLEWAMKYVQECNKLCVAVVDIEFFNILSDGKRRAASQLYGIDSSKILKMENNWKEVVKECNEIVFSVISEQILRDATQYCLITILEREEWLKWYPEKNLEK